MPIKKWWRLTPNQIDALDKDKTTVILPLATMGSAGPKTRVWEDYKAVQTDAKRAANDVNNAIAGSPMQGLVAIQLLPFWPGVEPGPAQAGTITLPQNLYEGVVEAICLQLKSQGIKHILIVARDTNVTTAAKSVANKLNNGLPSPSVVVFNSLQVAPTQSRAGDVCRAICSMIGCNGLKCPP